jgi:5-methylcytosine-specific restriction protein B
MGLCGDAQVSGFDAHDALVYLRGQLAQELGIQPLHPESRTKGQIFELPGSKRQFALILGTMDSATGRWGGKEATVVLEVAVPSGLEGVTPLNGAAQLATSVLNVGFSRLKAPHQKLASVSDAAGLRNLLAWYASATGDEAPHVTPANPLTVHSTEHMRSLNMPLATNTILYGPPGTGKTYETSHRAVLLCDGHVSDTRAELMARYEQLRAEQRITFITFHQSYGYEEFVEGLRPRMDTASRQVVYDVVPGTFRRACDSARLLQLVKPGLGGKSLHDRTIWKMGLGVMGRPEGTKVFQYCMENSCVLLGWGEDVDFTECQDADAIRKKLKADKPQIDRLDSQVSYVEAFKNELAAGDIIVVAKGNSQFRAIGEVIGEYEFVEDAPFHQMRRVKWLAVYESGRPVDELYAKQFTLPALYKLRPDSIRLDNLDKLVSSTENAKSKPHVFIIDEINRANISKVFGELITLLEPDKREGSPNALSVKLPYSGDDFSVPANLHVVGTMNTADRSIALLDTALRRRFDFEELMPDPSTLNGRVVQGVDLASLLRSLNERIEVVYDRDHSIGHAFFLDVKALPDLDAVFRRKVLPLLQEYFYENWSKVRRVLNDLGDGDFIRKAKLAPLASDGEDDYVDEPRTVYSVNKNPFTPAAYKRIYGAA